MVWFCKTKTWWKSKIVLYECRHFHCIHKNRLYLKDIAGDVETRFDNSNYELNRKKKNVIWLMNDEWDGKIMTIFVGLRAKNYGYLTDDGSQEKNSKDSKERVS